MTEKLIPEQEATMVLLKSKSNEECISTTTVILVDRQALTIEGRHQKCSYEAVPTIGIEKRLKENLREKCACSRQRLWKLISEKLPILDWLIGYDVKNWLLGDVIAGITVAIMHIPQGMGFALLANVPAICGIYMAFFQSLIYAIFATSRHNSMGSFAVITLMTGKVVKELATFPPDGALTEIIGGSNETNIESFTESVSDMLTISPDALTYTPIQIATIVCFMVGIWDMILGLLQLGSLSVFLSDMLVSGFTTAAAFHVLTSQMKDLLGIKVQAFNGPLKIIYTYIAIAKALPTVNIATLIITFITIGTLLLNNEILKPKVAKFTKIPVPIELIAVVIGTASSYLANFEQTFHVDIVGDIPTGLPPPTLPPMELLQKVIVDSLVIAIVAYTVSFSLAKIFANRHGYSVDATQELYAHGIGNIFSSFFACPPMASALARTIIQDAVGGVTQMASLVCCAILVLVLLFVGPVFETLPKAVLASIIIVALKSMFLQTKDMIDMWYVSKIEAITWLVTFFSVVVIDIDFGLLIGVVFSIFVLLAKNQKPTTIKLGRVPNTDLYLDLETYSQAKKIPGVSALRITGTIHFANRENLRSYIISRTGLDPKVISKMFEKMKKKNPDFDIEKIMMPEYNDTRTYNLEIFHEQVRYIVLDVSGISYVDSAAGKFLDQLRAEYEKVGISLCFAGFQENVWTMMDRCGALKSFPSHHLFHSMHDAVIILTTQVQQITLT